MSAWRLKAVAFALLLFAIVSVMVWLGLVDLFHLVNGFRERRPFISSSRYMLACLLLSPVGASFGVLLLVSRQATTEEMRKAAGKPRKGAKRYLLFVPASIVAALIAPIVQYLTVDHLAKQRGHVACPTPDWPRHQPDRWALPGSPRLTDKCPRDGADPNA